MSRRRKGWQTTDKIEIVPVSDVPDEILEEEDVTKPHPLPSLMRDGESSATVGDLNDVFGALWERMDRIKIAGNRRKRDTDGQLKDMGDIPKRLASMAFKIKILWGVGAFALAIASANLYAGAKYLYGKGGQDAEQALTLKLLAETSADQGRRLRSVEDNSIKLIQRIEDLLSRRGGRNDADSDRHSGGK